MSCLVLCTSCRPSGWIILYDKARVAHAAQQCKWGTKPPECVLWQGLTEFALSGYPLALRLSDGELLLDPDNPPPTDVAPAPGPAPAAGRRLASAEQLITVTERHRLRRTRARTLLQTGIGAMHTWPADAPRHMPHGDSRAAGIGDCAQFRHSARQPGRPILYVINLK